MAVGRIFICILLLYFVINECGYCDGKLQQSSAEEKTFNTGTEKQNFRDRSSYSINATTIESDQAIHFRNFRFNKDYRNRNSLEHGLIVDLIPQPKLNVTEYSRITTLPETHKVEELPVEKKNFASEYRPMSSLKLGDKLTRTLNRQDRDVENSRSNRYRNPYQRIATPPTLELLPAPPHYDNKENNNRKSKSGKGGRSRKQGGRKKIPATETGEDLDKKVKIANKTDRKSRKKGESKNLPPPYVQEGKSSRRLRQHMQHKKKVKQFLQKRIQEQIEQRRHRRGLLIGKYYN